MASAVADKCVELVEKQETGRTDNDSERLIIRAKALKGLIELVNGSSIESGSAKCLFVHSCDS